jgi:L-fuconolactonase
VRRRVGGDPVGADLGVQGGSHDVGATALVQTVTFAEETPEFLVPAESHDLIAGVVGRGGPHRPDMADDLARLRALPGGRHLKGIRHQVQGEPDRRRLLRPERRGPAAVADAGLVDDLVVLPHQLPACAEAAAALPGIMVRPERASVQRVRAGSSSRVGGRKSRT